ncbi:nitrate reductase [Shimia abyssi]|uniref:Assimilatory nitrate reductase (NADH) alpha subunit apoprotein n=1 Tax=Shimia abyssi TaxID=1662395 RepID=A0A2P8FHM2_9RHOB|nr:nitrate reductase [Shimia abyssi]PSL21223.1 assimilatory nitrate reductase (NADH) alpha subunit apoprotein [Shimia abyssi]
MKDFDLSPANATCTTCPYCGTGCGVLAAPDGAGGLTIKGDPTHPANAGRLCSKGSALGETVASDGRLLTPQIDNRPASWDHALDLVASRFSETIAKHGPDSVAFYVSGQLLTEDYYVANKLIKGFLGTANIDTNSRLCMASTVAGHKRAFGTDTVPGTYEDLEQADLVVLVGSNLAWCHPVLYQRLAAAKATRPNMRVIAVDPRRTATTDLADMHLAINAGTDVALFNRLLSEIHEQGAVNAEFVTGHVTGFDAALDAASSTDVTVTGIPHAQLTEFLNLWIRSERVVTVFSQGVNQSDHGTDKVNAILNCHLATGRIGQPGMGPLSVTGQPNAMGGREVGGLANMLACHLDIENPEHRALVGGFWNAPNLPDHAGLKAVDMFRAVSEGRIKALWVMCTNPAVSLPQADFVRDAIANCDFTVVSDLTATTDTACLANVVLPATGWGEKDGTVTNSDRVISRQRAVLPKTGQSRHDWDIISDVARRMGWQDAFDYSTPAEIFREYAALSGLAAAQGKDFDISGLSDLTNSEYDALHPTRWPIPTRGTSGDRMFADGRFFTPSTRANMLALTQSSAPPAVRGTYRLNTGRIRDQWHTMTRTALSPRLNQHTGEPFLEIHPQDALAIGLKAADLTKVESRHGYAILRVLITDRVRPGAVFAPIHWTSEYASAGRICTVIPSATDPISGQPDTKAAQVSITPFAPTWYGFAVSSSRLSPDTGYWAAARHPSGWRTELAGQNTPDSWETFAQTLFAAQDATFSSVIDQTRRTARVALHQNGQLIGALYAAPNPVAVSRSYVANLLGSPGRTALAGHPGADQPDPGTTICACFNVGVNTILNAITTQDLLSVEQIGVALSAGSNCGSCKPELAALLTSARTKTAAE